MSQRQKRSNDPNTPLAEYSTTTTGISNNNPFANSTPPQSGYVLEYKHQFQLRPCHLCQSHHFGYAVHTLGLVEKCTNLETFFLISKRIFSPLRVFFTLEGFFHP